MRPITLEDLYQEYRNRPVVIRDAIMRTNSHPTIINSVTRATLRVLTRLVCRAEKTNGQAPVMARISHLAREAECEEKTVRRAIGALVELGWLAMPNVCRNEYGVYTSKEYHFTESFCRLVRLPCPSGSQAEVNATGTEMSDGAVYVDLSFKEDQRQIEKEKREDEKREIELPPELNDAAEEFSMNRSGMALLRGLAHRAGYLLEDIIVVGRDYLHKVKATKNRAHRYLESMIRRQSDYAERAAQIRRIRFASVEDRKEIERFVATHVGKVFESEDRRELVAVAADGRSAIHRLAGIDKTVPLVSAQDIRHLAERMKIGHLVERKVIQPVATPPQESKASTAARSTLDAALAMMRANGFRNRRAGRSATA